MLVKTSEKLDCMHIYYANYGVGEKKLQSLLGFWSNALMLGCHKQKWHWLALENAIKGMFDANIGDGLNEINHLVLKILCAYDIWNI